MKDTFQEQLKKIEEREKQLRNQKIAILNRKRKSEVVLTNRQKIVLGSVLMNLVKTDLTLKKAAIKCIDSMNSKDRELYTSFLNEINTPSQPVENKDIKTEPQKNKGE